QFAQSQAQALLVQDTHDDALAMIRGEAGDTKVDDLVADTALDAAVLRNPALRNGHVRHDLQSADDRGLKALGRGLDLMQDAVDPVSNAEAPLERFEGDAGAPPPGGLDDHAIDQLDDGRVGIDDRPVIGIAQSPDGSDLDLTLGDVLDHLRD